MYGSLRWISTQLSKMKPKKPHSSVPPAELAHSEQARDTKNLSKTQRAATGGAGRSCCPQGIRWEDAGGVQIHKMKVLPFPAPDVQQQHILPCTF